MSFGWSEARVIQLQELWRAGYSSGVIALKMGCSRNAVVGKISRLRKEGWSFADRTPHSAIVERPRRPLDAARGRPTQKPRRGAQRPTDKASFFDFSFGAPPARPAPPASSGALPEGAEPSKQPETMERVPFLELKTGQCRFPLWGPDERTGTCCGNKAVPGQPYCAHHARIAYKPAPQQKRGKAREAEPA